MKTIEVKEFSAMPGMEYNAPAYPGNGAYLNGNGNLFFVLNGCVYSVIGGIQLVGEAIQGELVTSSAGVSEGFILKALAIVQNPQLAVELAK